MRCDDKSRHVGGDNHAGSSDTQVPLDASSNHTRTATIELGVELLAHLEDESLPLPEVMDRIESVTTDPMLVREILDTAERRGIIAREDARIRVCRRSTFVRFGSQVIQREGKFDCRRCGASLTTGHFIKFDEAELGPFGPDCVRKVLGRD